MNPVLMATFGIISMFLLIVLHVPIGFSMAAVGVIGFGMLSGFGPAFTILATEASDVMSNVELSVVPLFLLMGNFATISGLSADIYNLAYVFVGHFRGGLALATIGGCGFFGAICGSSPATAATFGRVALPEMLRRGYSPALATGCIAAGGTLGSIVPPSVILVIYSFMTETLILELFIAAFIPAIISIAAYSAAVMVYVRLKSKAGPAGPRRSWPDRLRAVYRSWIAVLVLVVVVGGIYGGVFTVTEAAAIGAALTFIFALVRRKMTIGGFWNALLGTAVTTGMIYVIIIGANVFTYFISITHMADAGVQAISNLNLSPSLVLIFLFLMYLILGSIFDTIAAMLITLPFVLPLILSMGYDPIWWGIMNVVVCEIGMITPPIGINVFVLHGVAPEIPLGIIFRGILPFLGSDAVRLAILAAFPVLSLWLLNLLR